MSSKLTILVAEDDMVTRRLIEKFLRGEGHTVQAFENGEDAWRTFQNRSAHVVVSDWIMPDTDGLDLCRRVRSVKRDEYTYFILLTSLSRTHENIHAAVEAGVDDFLTKPINPDDLWMRLRVASRILHYAGQVRQLESLLPICAYCKKVRNDANLWEAVETYLTEHTGMDLSHSICPDCYRRYVQAELDDLKREPRPGPEQPGG
jgi:DNA-binding response OmpR family regulator